MACLDSSCQWFARAGCSPPVIVICILLLPGCVPMASLAGAALDVLNEGGGSVVAPLARNASTTQNRRPENPAISEALAQADQRQVMEVCKAKLPPQQIKPAPNVGCTVRSVCLPGSTVPLRLRVCYRNAGATPAVVPAAPSRGPGWAWGMSKATGVTPILPAESRSSRHYPSQSSYR
jgi:hypothetical protein